MSDIEGAFRLTFVEGRGLLSLAARDIAAFGRVEKLELEIPNLRFPFDLSGGVTRFKNHRLRLREMAVSFEANDLAGFLRVARLADYGLHGPEVEIDDGLVRIGARAVLGDRQAEFTATGALTMVQPGRARLSMFDVRVYGFLPVPPPLLVTALFTALGAAPSQRSDEGVAPLLHIEGATDLEIDARELALLALLPMHGWRMPERRHLDGTALRAEAAGQRLTVAFFPSQDAHEQAASSAMPDRLAEYTAATSRLAAAESALLAGDLPSALESYRQAAPVESGDQAATARLLNLLTSAVETLTEAENTASAALERWPGLASAFLVEAIAASESGRPAQAAELFENLAGSNHGSRMDRAFALLAAARHWARAEQMDRAVKALEESLAHRSMIGPAVRALALRFGAEGRWDEILPMLARRALHAKPGSSDDVGAAIEMAELAVASGEPDLCAKAVDVLDGLLLREDWPDPAVPRAEAARQMAALCSVLGDEEAAIEWLNDCLQSEAPGSTAQAARQRLVDIYAQRGDARAAVQALTAWAGDARTPDAAEQRAACLCEAARLLRETLSEREEAVSLLESALRVDPTCVPALDALQAIAGETGNWAGLAEVLHRRLAEVRPEDAKVLLQRLGSVLADRLRDEEQAVATYRVLLDLDPAIAEARLGLARLLWRAGEREESQREYGELLHHPACTTAMMGEAYLCFAQTAQQAGQAPQVEAAIAAALSLEPDGAPLDLLVAGLRELGQGTKLAECLVMREQALDDGPARIAVTQALAEVLEQMGKLDEAEAACRRLLEQAPDDLRGLARLAAICRQQSRSDELTALLDRLWAALDGQQVPDGLSLEAIGLELADLLLQKDEGRGQAESILRRLADRGSRAALEALSAFLTKKGALDEADALLLARVDSEAEGATAAALLVERARLHLVRPEGEGPALMLLQSVGRAVLPDDALGLRADLAEKAGDVIDALACWQSLRALRKDNRAARDEVDRRLAALVVRPTVSTETARAMLEELHNANPSDEALAASLFEVYGRQQNIEERNRVWGALLEQVPGLPAVCHARWHLAQAEAAERSGNAALAEDELARASALDRGAQARAGQLAVQARLAAGRGQLDEAGALLDEALALSPDHGSVLAAQADLAYRAQEWDKARQAYARLAVLPDAAAAYAPDKLALRRAELAEMFGDSGDAENAYQDLARLDPQHAGAREALAGFALARNDRAGAVAKLEEVLRLLPRDAVTRLTDIRHRLGETYLALGNLAAARENLEMALASDPDRAGVLESLVETYQQLGLHREAAAGCERLARKLDDPHKKAEAIYRRGEILRVALGDLEGANDAYLRSSDLDPSFAPTQARLVTYYWQRGDLGNLAEVGSGLIRAASSPLPGEPDLPLLVALAAIVASKDEELVRTALAEVIFDAEPVARRLGELVRMLCKPASPGSAASSGSESGVRKLPGTVAPGGSESGMRKLQSAERGIFEKLDAVFASLRTATPLQFEADLCAAALRSVLGDPADLGPALLAAYLQQRCGRPALARAARDLALFLDPELPLKGSIASLGAHNPARATAWSPTVAEHPLCRGPLRRVLRALAPALAEMPHAGGAPVEGAPLQPKAESVFRELRDQLGAPVPRAVVRGAGAEVTFAVTQPLTVVVGERAESLDVAELCFLVGRALEQARAGTLAVARLSVGDLRALLRGVIRAVSLGASDGEAGGKDSENDRAGHWAALLSQPPTDRLMPTGKVRADLLVEAGEALARPPDLEGYVRGCRYTADRVGLLCCGSPLVALRALAGQFKHDGTSPAEVGRGERQERVRSSTAMRENIAFMLSDEYASLVED
ncbi:MAG: tetratricopeptide repeat protein [Polyangia bacterium]